MFTLINLSIPSVAPYVYTIYCCMFSIICTERFASPGFLCLYNVFIFGCCSSIVLHTVARSLSQTNVSLSAYRKDFEELFDVIITNALKPGFFSLVPQQRPFRTLGEY